MHLLTATAALFVFVSWFAAFAAAEMFAHSQEAKTPNARQTDDRIDQTAKPGSISFAQPRNEVKLEKSPKTPVDRSDNNQDQRKNI